jgi:hypothetical protein
VIFASLLLILVAIVLAVLGVVQGSDPLLVGSILASLLTAVFLAAGARQAAAMRLAGGRDGFLVPFLPVRRGRRIAAAPADGSEAVPASVPVTDPGGTVYGRPPSTTGEPDSGDIPEADSADIPQADGAADVDRGELAPADDPEVAEESSPATRSVPGAVSGAGVVPGPGVVSIPSQDGPADRDNERLTPTSADFDGPAEQPDVSLAEPAPPDRPTQVELDLRPDDGIDDDLLVEDLDPDDDPLDEPPAQLVPPADAALIARLDTSVMVVDGRPRYHLVTCVHLLGREVQTLPVGEAVELGFTPCNLCEPDTTLLAQARRG